MENTIEDCEKCSETEQTHGGSSQLSKSSVCNS